MAITLTGNAGVTTNSGAVYDSIQRGTAVTASGTSVDFTGIPSWAKRITVMFESVSTNGTSLGIIQLGDSGGIETTGYLGGGAFSGSTNQVLGYNATNGIYAGFGTNAANIFHGCVTIINMSGNLWVSHSSGGFSNTNFSSQGGSSKTLSSTLDRVRITTVNGTDTFDAGSINIIYE